MTDLDTGLVHAVGITPANVPEASVTDSIAADLAAAGRTLAELHIDRAYLSSALVRDRSPDLVIYRKAWRVRNATGRYAKDQFSIDFGAGQLTCPAGAAMPFTPGKTVRFPRETCAACALRARCTSSSNGRSVAIHPDEALLAELRQRQITQEALDDLPQFRQPAGADLAPRRSGVAITSAVRKAPMLARAHTRAESGHLWSRWSLGCLAGAQGLGAGRPGRRWRGRLRQPWPDRLPASPDRGILLQ